MANDLANDLLRPSIVGFGSPLLVLQAERSVLKILVAELEVALFAVPILLGGVQRAEFSALALDQHRKPSGDIVTFRNGQRAMGAREFCRHKVHGDHRCPPLLLGC